MKLHHILRGRHKDDLAVLTLGGLQTNRPHAKDKKVDRVLRNPSTPENGHGLLSRDISHKYLKIKDLIH